MADAQLQNVPPPALIVERQSSPPITLNDPNHALEWVNKELASWQWLNEAAKSQPSLQPTQADIYAQLNAARDSISSWAQNEQNRPGTLKRLQRLSRSRVPLTSDPIFGLASALQDAGDPIAAGAAIATHMGKLRYVNDQDIPFSITRGVVAAALLDAGVAPETPTAVKASLDGLYSEFSSKLSQAAIDIGARRNEAAELIAIVKQKFLDVETEIKTAWAQKIEESIAKILATDAAFTKQMQLRASVQYWTAQESDQKTNARTFLKVLAVFAAVVLLAAIVATYKYVPTLLAHKIADAPSLYAVSATLTLLVSTIVFWACRVLVRLYLSAHHLSIDAAERVVMI